MILHVYDYSIYPLIYYATFYSEDEQCGGISMCRPFQVIINRLGH